MLRVLTLNVKGSKADAEAISATVAALDVDILAVQELTEDLVRRLALTRLDGLLPHNHLDPREGSRGTGLWARWPLTPLAPVAGVLAATPRARIDRPGGPAVTVTAVHPVAPVADQEHRWRRELGLIQAALAGARGPATGGRGFQRQPGSSRVPRPAPLGFVDCADAARHGPGPLSPGRPTAASRR